MQHSTPGLFEPHAVAKNIMGQYEAAGAFHQYNGEYTPSAGDTIFFHRGNEAWQGHAGFISEVHADGSITIIEGNKEAIESDNIDAPDVVREYTYSPEELMDNRIIGFGDSYAMFQASGATLNIQQPQTSAIAVHETHHTNSDILPTR